MPNILKRVLFGDPLLRGPIRQLSAAEAASEEVQMLIADMQHTLVTKKYGVGLAAPQIGHNVALSVICIKPMPHRPDVKEEDLVVINPKIVKTYGSRTQMWEGCISFQGNGADFPYAKALRYRKVRLSYLDGLGEQHEEDFEGLLAHVLQHETDHLNGILFVERVSDPKTYMMMSEFKKHILPLERDKTSKAKKRSPDSL